MKNLKIIMGILLLVTLLIGGYVYVNKQYKYKSNTQNLSGYVIGEGVEPNLTPEQIKALMQKKVDASKVAFSIYSEPTFKGTKGTIMFANPRYSAHNLDLEVRVDNKVIIKTEKISPDQYIKDIELIGKPLKKGKHKAIASIKAYDRKTGKIVGEVAVDMVITSK